MTTIAMCGSMRYINQMRYVSRGLIRAGYTVLLPTHAFDEDDLDGDDIVHLHRHHKDIILKADCVVVYDLDPTGTMMFLGEHTMEEIKFAKKHKKPVLSWFMWGAGCWCDRGTCGPCIRTEEGSHPKWHSLRTAKKLKPWECEVPEELLWEAKNR